MRRLQFFALFALFTVATGTCVVQAQGTTPVRVIVFVWDGLRVDDLTPEITPNYLALARSGVIFADHHAIYPTFTMMNSASIATGAYPGAHGFYGNVVYVPSAKGKNAKGADIDFSAPAFIEDFGVIEAVRKAYQDRLTLLPTMLQAAQAKGLTTAAVGKFGAAFIQDYARGGIILDEDALMPIDLAKELQQAGYAIPRNSRNAYAFGTLTLARDNGDPTAPIPIAKLKDGQTADIDPHGYAVSGFVRTAELLTRDGLKAYDGAGCRNIPILSGIMSDGTHLYPVKDDHDGDVCGREQNYTSMRYVVPTPLPPGAIVVAANAGSDYLFVPDRNIETVRAAVTSLQGRLQFGAIFVSDRYGEIPGTLPLSIIKSENSDRAPDIIVSFSYDETAAVAGKSGVSYASSVNRRGDHGSFSPTDVRISLMANGPHFKAGLLDPLPSANVDIAPTLARIFGLSMPDAQGRVLEEALQNGSAPTEYKVLDKVYRSSTRTGLKMKMPIDLDGQSIDPKLMTYSVQLKAKFLSRGDATYSYFDEARAIRE